MKQTKRLISQLELQYGNNHMGLASQVGYLTGVLKSMESEVEGISKFIEDHTDYLIQSERSRAGLTRALIRGGVPAEQVMQCVAGK